ncbi:chitin synthase chs-1-like [Saccostrea cucullata]|uniref:chitin synthase chs-1-like n=1 Tax=Saccostrea cuccullata TaxID=36930 RepID=UPI002ED2C429
MCINLLNDKLQGYIFDQVIEHEKDIHGDEDMDPHLWDIKLENDTVVDVFENKMIGIWQILSTESSPPYGRDVHLVTRLEWNLRDYTPQIIEFSKGRSSEFCIKHCAGEIWYNCENILDKNRDKLTDYLGDVVKNSKHQHINFLFSADFSGTFSRNNTGQRRKPKTDLISYRDSVNELLKELESSTPHFVRCIKPREEQSTSLFDKDVVGKQLRYNGILQLAKFRNHELSVRIPKKNFKKRYQIIPPELHAESQREACFQTGQTKVFMNEGIEIYNEKELKKKKRPKEEVKTEEDQFRRLRTGGQSTGSDLENEVNDQTNVKQCQSNDKENNETESSIPNTNFRLKTKFWDRFQVLDREKKQNDVHSHTSFRIIKVLVYFCLFAILLTSLVIQKITLVIATSKLKSSTEMVQNSTGNTTVNEEISTSGVHSLLLVFVICTPYVLNFLASCWKVLFGNMERPSFASVFMCVIIEAFHSIGLSILVFELMPELGAVQRICVLNAIAIIPSVLKPFTVREQRPVTTCGKIAIIIFDVFAMIIQISVIPILLIPKTDFLPEKDQIEMTKDKEGIPGIFEGLSYHSFMYITIFAVFVFTSLSWWENFVADNGCISKILQGGINKIKGELHGSRPYFGIIVSITKIAMTTLSARLLVGERLGLLNPEFWSAVAKYNDVELFSDIIVLIVSAFLGYYAAYTACKLKMQIFSFSIPCLISTPIFVTLMVYHCNDSDSFLSVISSINLDIACDHNHGLEDNWLHIAVITAWLISLYWVSQHIWFPSQERLAKMKRLFVNPLYCGILIEQHLVMNRRRRFEEISKTEKTKPNDEEDCNTKSNENNDEDGNEREAESNGEKKIYPRVFACATLWHETLNEMKQLLKSLYRIDKDQSERNDDNEDYYEFEAHILFDDVFQKNNLNEFVKSYESALNETASSVHGKAKKLEEPIIICTVYGAQVIYRMPCGNLMFIHLKDETKIRKKKRWSQVMYMYYLLGYRLSMEVYAEMNQRGWKQAKTFNQLMTPRANNTFLLALDGDVDFSPGSLRILVDRMRKDDGVGATCGRIHPIGSGPIVWYQKFEYAVAHWLQKATEHVLGCVLCSPGCFSLFRGSALMAENVMNKYTQLPTEASHHLMYDQGEDRWLCTLLLQQGFRVDYAAGADAFTHAPEGFDEYFKQRKRWGPSTLANIMSLLQDCRNTVQENANISWLYIVYQASLLVATIIGPATIIMMIAGAFVAVFGVDLMISYIASLAPVILYFIICVTCKSKIQLLVAQILSGIYVIIMIVVLVGVIITAVTESPFHPSVVFLCGIIAIFIIAALFHPREWYNLLFGLLYFVLVPCGFLVLIIYSLCNLNDVSWGTRESSNAKGKAKEKKDIFSKMLSPFRKLKGNESKPFLSEDEIKELVEKMIEEKNQTTQDGAEITRNTSGTSRQQSVESNRCAESIIKVIFKEGKCIEMTKEEDKFWNELITTCTG